MRWEGLSKEVTFELRPEWYSGASQSDDEEKELSKQKARARSKAGWEGPAWPV